MRTLVAASTALIAIATSGNALADVTLGPAVQPGGPGHVTVVWQGTNTVSQAVTLRSEGRADVVASTAVKNGVHAVDFANLVPGVEYRYAIDGREGRFLAPPDASQTLRFAVFGDSRTGNATHRQIVESVAALRPDFYLTTGDDVQVGDDMAAWKTFFDIERPLMSVAGFSGVRGNHDVGSVFQNMVRMPGAAASPTWGSLDMGPAHFVLIDSESPVTPGSVQYDFIDRDLAANRGKPLFALLHRPLFSSGSHGGSESPQIKDSLGPLFQRYGVDLVFQGHDHHYERTTPINGVTYVVTGGAGAPLYSLAHSTWTAAGESVNHYMMVEASASSIRVRTYRLDGSLLDQFTIDPAANEQNAQANAVIPASGGGCSVGPAGTNGRAALGQALVAAVAMGYLASRRRRRARVRAHSLR